MKKDIAIAKILLIKEAKDYGVCTEEIKIKYEINCRNCLVQRSLNKKRTCMQGNIIKMWKKLFAISKVNNMLGE